MEDQITSYIQRFVREHVKAGDFCIDATAGNGKDTLLLCQLAGKSGRVLGFDIQMLALERTRKLLDCYQCKAELILESHLKMGDYAKEDSVDCIMFNFGYLPRGDHKICTKPESSVAAVEAGLSLLKPGGMMTLCIYSGRDSGFEERDALLSYLKILDEKRYLVILSCYYNRGNHPPIPIVIKKLR